MNHDESHGYDKFPTDPKLYAAGIWWTIHTLSIRAIDELTKQRFIDYMDILKINFPCNTCRSHINSYMSSHPFDDLYDVKDSNGNHTGLFIWGWMFHNAVNTRLGKPYMAYETAFKMYNPDNTTEVCNNCGSDGDHNTQISSQQTGYKNPSINDKKKIVQGYFNRK